MAKKGKQKKRKAFHPYLVSGGIFLILLVASVTFWIFGGRKLFIATPGVQRNFDEAKTLFATDFKHVQDAKEAEDRMNSLVGKAGNKAILTALVNQVNTDVTSVSEDNTKLNLAVIALDQMTVPLSSALAKNHLTHGTKVLTEWKDQAKNYYELSSAYALLVSNIAEYKEGVYAQSFDKQNSNDAIASHQKLKGLCSDILTQSSKVSDLTGEKLDGVTAYFEKAKTYHEKNIFFYEADKKQDLTTQKLLVTDISNLKNDLAKMDPVSELQGFDTSHLSALRATLNQQEKTLESDYNAFKNKAL